MLLLDTNVLIYATGADHPLQAGCRRILASIGTTTQPIAVTDTVIAEFVHARSRRSSRQEAVALAAEFVAAVDVVVPLNDASRRRALALYAATSRISINDALIAAAALEANAVLVSADADFEEVAGLEWLRPTSAELEGLLA